MATRSSTNRNGQTIRVMSLGVERRRRRRVPGRLRQYMEALDIARLRLPGLQRLDGERVARRRRTEETQRLGVAEAGQLGGLIERAGPVGRLDEGPNRGGRVRG